MRKVGIILILLLLCLNAFGENINPIAPPSPYEQNQTTILGLLGELQAGVLAIKENQTISVTPEDLNVVSKLLQKQITETKEVANSKVDAGTVVVIVIFVSVLNWGFFFLMKGWGKA